MTKTSKTISQPSKAAERAQREIARNTKTEVEVRGRKYRIGAVYNDTLDWITDIQLAGGNEKQIPCKCAAALWLNGFFKLRLFYWIVWRWWYFIRQYTDEELQGIIQESKKKVEAQSILYYVNTISLIDLRTTTMAMTMEEAEHFRAALSGAHRGAQPQAAKEESSSPSS